MIPPFAPHSSISGRPTRIAGGGRRSALLLFWVLAGMMAGGWGDQNCGNDATEGVLRLANGDEYEGCWLASQNGDVLWRTPWFSEPIVFDDEFLEDLDLVSVPTDYKDEPFRLLLRNGDVIHGQLEALRPDELVMRTERHGVVKLERSELLRLTRLNNPALIYSGPTSLEGWRLTARKEQSRRPMGRDQSYPAQLWGLLPGGGMVTERWRAELFHPLPLPPQVEIDVLLTSDARPEFTIAFQQDLENGVRLETWNDALVVVQGSQFSLVKEMPEDLRSLRLRLFWDRAEGSLAIFDDQSSLLAQTRFAPVEDHEAGFFIRNKTIDLTVNHLRVARWNGNPPRKTQERGVRIRTTDGGVLRDEIVDFVRPNYQLVLSEGTRLSMEEIDTIYFREEERVDERSGVTEFSYPDGTRITGDFVGVQDQVARVITDYSLEPVEVRLAGMQRIRFPGGSSEASYDRGDQLTFEGGSYQTFRGQVTGAVDQESSAEILWNPLGAKNAVPLADTYPAKILRDDSQAVSNLDGDRLFMKTGEILSCRIEAMEPAVVRIRTSLSELREVPAGFVKAVEFRDDRLQMVGFGDRGWVEDTQVEGDLEREAGKILLN
ncbi:MAG: hypothetical protein AAF191_08065, partial [Verrucomicrobiota bacterium]